MLAMIESGRVASAVDCRPRAAIYLAIWDHVYRAAGLRWWDRRGPRFALDGEGRAERLGNADDDEGLSDVVLRFVEKRSQIAKRLRERARQLEPGDFDLFFALLRAARERLEALYTGIEIIVIGWDLSDGSAGPWPLTAEFRTRGLPLERYSEILDRAGEDRDGLTIPLDGHPTGRANRVLADHLAGRLRGTVRPPNPQGTRRSQAEVP